MLNKSVGSAPSSLFYFVPPSVSTRQPSASAIRALCVCAPPLYREGLARSQEVAVRLLDIAPVGYA